MTPSRRIVVDEDLCQAHGVCEMEAPGIFAVDSSRRRVEILDPTPGADRTAEVEAAIRYCPTRALSIQED